MGVSTFNGINVALRGLIAQQRALDVTTHNIANASTDGYTRQEAVLEAADPISNVSVWGMLFPGQLGQGVTVDSYRRIRDVFNDVQLRAATSEQVVARRALPRAARHLAGHPGAVRQRHPVARARTSSTPGTMSATRPSRSPPASRWRRPGSRWRRRFNHASTTFSTMRANDNTEIDADIGDANAILTQIASLNTQIGQLVLAGAQLDPATMQIVKAGQAPNDLLDRRDLLLDKLGKLANVVERHLRRPEPRDGRRRRADRGHADAGATAITRAQMDAQFASGGLAGGALHALEDAYTNLLNEATATSYPSQLNVLAQSLHDAVNAQHALGVDLSGTAGGDVLRLPAATGPPGAAGRITCRPAILADPTKIAAGVVGQGPGSATQRQRDRLALQQRRSRPVARRSSTTTRRSSSGSARPRRARPAHRRRAPGIVVEGLSDRRLGGFGRLARRGDDEHDQVPARLRGRRRACSARWTRTSTA